MRFSTKFVMTSVALCTSLAASAPAFANTNTLVFDPQSNYTVKTFTLDGKLIKCELTKTSYT
ncbi:hypothetical protein [Psittacicella hinzii]|uniref:Uncharacterized protein n=1 Tax=Psittacicella hinzii TaxID=2028575 RepID=A0A3A1YMU8_9GAMM|nr:hypothetical protein [Psittacicella hinzii]RIY38881.1 hypothetical protein CKF58_03155 [Psittacicella hinzii]